MKLKKMFWRSPVQAFLPVATALFLNPAQAQEPVPDWPALDEVNLQADLQAMESLLGPALAADANNNDAKVTITIHDDEGDSEGNSIVILKP